MTTAIRLGIVSN